MTLIEPIIALLIAAGTYWWGRWVGRAEYREDHLVEVYKAGYDQACDDVCEQLEQYKNMLTMEEEMRDE